MDYKKKPEDHAYNSMAMEGPSENFIYYPQRLMALVPESSTVDAADMLFVIEVNFADHRLLKYISLAMVFFFSLVKVIEL